MRRMLYCICFLNINNIFCCHTKYIHTHTSTKTAATATALRFSHCFSPVPRAPRCPSGVQRLVYIISCTRGTKASTRSIISPSYSLPMRAHISPSKSLYRSLSPILLSCIFADNNNAFHCCCCCFCFCCSCHCL